MRRFVGEAVQVEMERGAPHTVCWAGRRIAVEVRAEVDRPDRSSDWRLRRHHRRFLVEDGSGLLLELRQDRQGCWTLWAVDDQA